MSLDDLYLYEDPEGLGAFDAFGELEQDMSIMARIKACYNTEKDKYRTNEHEYEILKQCVDDISLFETNLDTDIEFLAFKYEWINDKQISTTLTQDQGQFTKYIKDNIKDISERFLKSMEDELYKYIIDTNPPVKDGKKDIVYKGLFNTLTKYDDREKEEFKRAFQYKVLLVYYDLLTQNSATLDAIFYKWKSVETTLLQQLELNEADIKIVLDHELRHSGIPESYFWGIIDYFFSKRIPVQQLSWVSNYKDIRGEHFLPNTYMEVSKKTVAMKPVNVPDTKSDTGFLFTSRYYPRPPTGKITLTSIDTFLDAVQHPYTIKDGQKHNFDFSTLDKTTVQHLKPLLLQIIHIVAEKTILEKMERHIHNESDLNSLFNVNLTNALQVNMLKVYTILLDNKDVLDAKKKSIERIISETGVLTQTGLQRRMERRYKTQRHYVTTASTEVLTDIFLVRTSNSALPDKKYVFTSNPVNNGYGIAFYHPTQALIEELFDMDSTRGKGGIINNGTEYILGYFKDGIVTDFTETDYNRMFLRKEFSGKMLYSQFQQYDVYRNRVYDTLHNLFGKDKPVFAQLYDYITSRFTTLSIIQVLQFFYCILIFNDNTFQLVDKSLYEKCIKITQEQINSIKGINADTEHNEIKPCKPNEERSIVTEFFRVMFDLKETSMYRAAVLEYVHKFIYKCIQDTFPFLIIKMSCFPCLPFHINSKNMLNSLLLEIPKSPEREQTQSPYQPYQVYSPVYRGSPPIGSPNTFGVRGRKKSDCCLLCGKSSSSSVPTVQFKKDAASLVNVCMDCIYDFQVSL